MKFLDKAKKVVIDRIEREIQTVEEKIEEVRQNYSREQEGSQNLKEEMEEFSQRKTESQKRVLDRKQLKNLSNIYDFLSSYQKIRMIVEEIKKMAEAPKNEKKYAEVHDGEIVGDNDLYDRYELYSRIKALNERISEIKDLSIEELTEVENAQNEASKKKEKKGILSKIFGRNSSKDERTIFDEYRQIIEEYNEYYNSFLVVDLEDGKFLVDETSIKKIMTNINFIMSLQKKGIELEEDQKIYIAAIHPPELWKEILKYYANISEISTIIKNFEREIDYYEEMYRESPELFDIETLNRILEENKQMTKELRTKEKDAERKGNEFIAQRQNEREMKAQLKELEEKRKELLKRKERVERAKDLKDLGYKSKEDAAKKLSIDTKDYIVIPIPNEIQNISQLFSREERLKIETRGREILTSYILDIAEGKINTTNHIEGVDAVMLIPIKNLQKDGIDSIKNGRIVLNSSSLATDGIQVISQRKRYINLEGLKIDIRELSGGNIKKYIESFLGEDHVNESDETENYEIFKNIPNISPNTRRARREAIKNALFENFQEDILHTDTILVNGKGYFLNKDDEKELQSRPDTEKLDEDKIRGICERIIFYLAGDEKRKCTSR